MEKKEKGSDQQQSSTTKGQGSTSAVGLINDKLHMDALVSAEDVLEILQEHGVDASRICKEEILKRLIFSHRAHPSTPKSNYVDEQELDRERDEFIAFSSEPSEISNANPLQSHDPYDDKDFQLDVSDSNAGCVEGDAFSSGKRPVTWRQDDERIDKLFKASDYEMQAVGDYDQETSDDRICTPFEDRPIFTAPRIPRKMAPTYRLIELRDFYGDAFDADLSRLITIPASEATKKSVNPPPNPQDSVQDNMVLANPVSEDFHKASLEINEEKVGENEYVEENAMENEGREYRTKWS